MSDAVIIAAITGSTTVIGGLVTVFGRILSRTLNKVHTLVNSNMGAQLRLTATASRRLAILTSEPSDIEAAELAEKLLKEHDAKQQKVDSNDR